MRLGVVVLALALASCDALGTPPTSGPVSSGAVAPSAGRSSAPAATSAAPASEPAEAGAPSDLGAWSTVRGEIAADAPIAAVSEDNVLVLDAGAAPCEMPSEEGPAPFTQYANVFSSADGAFDRSEPLDSTRRNPVVAPLPDGEVLVAGGVNDQFVPKSSVRIWQPGTNGWREGGLMNIARYLAGSAPLDDGRVLVFGGSTPGDDATATAELYDPKSDVWTLVRSMPSPRFVVATTTLANGDVFVVQEDDARFFASRYSPDADDWDRLDTIPGIVEDVVALPDGGALITGPTETVHRWHPDGGVSVAGTLRSARPGAAVATLADGRVLFAGGQNKEPGEGNADARTTAEVFDPASGRSEAIARMPETRNHAAAVPLEDGSVLVVGGWRDAFNGDTPWCPVLAEHALRWTP